MKKIITFIIILLLASTHNIYANNIAGDPSGKISLVEFYDPSCPHCQHMMPIIDTLIKNNPHLRVVYRSLDTAENVQLFYNLGAKYIPLIIIGNQEKILAVHSGEVSYEVLQHDIQ